MGKMRTTKCDALSLWMPGVDLQLSADPCNNPRDEALSNVHSAALQSCVVAVSAGHVRLQYVCYESDTVASGHRHTPHTPTLVFARLRGEAHVCDRGNNSGMWRWSTHSGSPQLPRIQCARASFETGALNAAGSLRMGLIAIR